jgi:hypothetical protein
MYNVLLTVKIWGQNCVNTETESYIHYNGAEILLSYLQNIKYAKSPYIDFCEFSSKIYHNHAAPFHLVMNGICGSFGMNFIINNSICI